MATDTYPLQDLLYRTTALTDDAGDIAEAYDTDAYGNTLIFAAAGSGGDWWADDATQTDNAICESIYTGRRYDTEAETYFYRARYYGPRLGRFVSRDRFVDDINLYSYVRLRSTRWLDPLGLAAQPNDSGQTKSPCMCELPDEEWYGYDLTKKPETLEELEKKKKEERDRSRGNCWRYATCNPMEAPLGPPSAEDYEERKRQHYRTPGGKQPRPGESWTCSFVEDAMTRLGAVKPVGDNCPEHSYMIYFMVMNRGTLGQPFAAPGSTPEDFHFVRQNIDGSWTHKPGVTRVTDKDYKGKVIRDPRTANWGDYALCKQPLCWPCGHPPY